MAAHRGRALTSKRFVVAMLSGSAELGIISSSALAGYSLEACLVKSMQLSGTWRKLPGWAPRTRGNATGIESRNICARSQPPNRHAN